MANPFLDVNILYKSFPPELLDSLELSFIKVTLAKNNKTVIICILEGHIDNDESNLELSAWGHAQVVALTDILREYKKYFYYRFVPVNISFPSNGVLNQETPELNTLVLDALAEAPNYSGLCFVGKYISESIPLILTKNSSLLG